MMVIGCSKGNCNQIQEKYVLCEGAEAQVWASQEAVGFPSLEIQNSGRQGAEQPDTTLSELFFQQGVGPSNPQMALPT